MKGTGISTMRVAALKASAPLDISWNTRETMGGGARMPPAWCRVVIDREMRDICVWSLSGWLMRKARSSTVKQVCNRSVLPPLAFTRSFLRPMPWRARAAALLSEDCRLYCLDDGFCCDSTSTDIASSPGRRTAFCCTAPSSDPLVARMHARTADAGGAAFGAADAGGDGGHDGGPPPPLHDVHAGPPCILHGAGTEQAPPPLPPLPSSALIFSSVSSSDSPCK
mmetsp:Transcript_73613/g.221288  ORF Transcript_73613/g.221288 Transcript_73613/m.221288 type:complete len:224 (+) Transcript_73613:1029-1700(+)